MPMPSFKIAILEKDGQEYGEVVEYDLAQALSEIGITAGAVLQVDGGSPDSDFNQTPSIDGGNI